MKKNWNNIKENNCPNCNGKLQFRLKGSVVNMKANKNFKKALNQEKDYHFCSRCDGFQITEEKLQKLKKKMRDDTIKSIPKKDRKVFSSGILRL